MKLTKEDNDNHLKSIGILFRTILRIDKIKSSSTFKGKKYDPSKAVLKIKKPVLGTNLYGPPVRTTGTVTSKFGKNVKSKSNEKILFHPFHCYNIRLHRPFPNDPATLH